MTLIVGQVLREGICLVGDLRITYPESAVRRPRTPEPRLTESMLKMVILSDRLVVAFAGEVRPALEIIRSLNAHRVVGVSEVTSALRDTSRVDQVEFLIGSLDRTTLFRIRDGR